MTKLTLPLSAFVAVAALCLTPLAAPAADEFSGASTGQSELSARFAAADPDYRISEEDVLRIDVWGEPQLANMQAQVTPDGKINVAFVGAIQAAGLTVDELRQEIVRKYAEQDMIYDAKIQVTLLSRRPLTARVLGEVTRPGAVVFKEGDTILDAIAQAGSYTNNAMLERATLTHKNSNRPIPIDLQKMLKGDLSQNYPLRDGDAVYIPPEDYENKIYVVGHVMRPGIYALKDKTSVLDALSLAGGPTPRGALRGTTVVRGDPAKPEKVPVDMTRLFDKADLSQDILLQSGDVVVVPESKSPDWQKISSILSTVLNITYIRRYGLF